MSSGPARADRRRAALPAGVDADRLIQYLRAKVPGYYYGDDPGPDVPDLNS